MLAPILWHEAVTIELKEQPLMKIIHQDFFSSLSFFCFFFLSLCISSQNFLSKIANVKGNRRELSTEEKPKGRERELMSLVAQKSCVSRDNFSFILFISFDLHFVVGCLIHVIFVGLDFEESS